MRRKGIHSFAVLLGLVLLVMACWALWNNWKELDFWEASFNILLLAHQALALIVDVVVIIMSSITMWVTIALAVVGLLILVACMLYEYFKEQPKDAISKWITDTGLPFVRRLPEAPELRFDWKIEPSTGTVGQDDTITVTAAAAKEKSAWRLKQIRVSFMFPEDDQSVLFNTTDDFVEKLEADDTLRPNQVSITCPNELKNQVRTGLLGNPASEM